MTTLENTIDAIDRLIGTTDREYGTEIQAPLMRCRETLAALSWERFRVRHEVLSRQATAARGRASFTARHKERRHG